MLCLVKFVSGVEESLGWDAANVQACSSEGSSLLDANGFKALLSGLDGSDVTCSCE